MHILSNISRNKNNLAIKFGQLIENDTRNISLEKNTFNIFPDLFLKKEKLSITLDQYSKVLYSLFLFDVKFRAIEIYWN